MKKHSLIKLVLLLFSALAASSCLVDEALLETATPVAPPLTGSLDWVTIYFTNPNDPDASGFRGGPDDSLAAAIHNAEASVDMAAYDLNLWSLRDALVAAHRNGVTVRVVTESDNLDEPEIQDLIEAGIEVLGDRREGLMHHKFIIIDRLEVWTGSMNFTTTDTYLNNNNLLRIRSSRLAENYSVEFNEMFEEDLFGPDDRQATPYPTVTIEGTRLDVLFSPDDGVLNHLLELVESAQKSIYFMAYSFTKDDLATMMLERAEAGVMVSGVFEESQYYSNIGSEFDNFLQAGIAVYLDGNSRNMHHKVIIIDEEIVVTGSYNFSTNAEERNDENTLVIYNTDIAQTFMEEFAKVLAETQK
ncbi:MAG: DUF1669 domain-containing protein [Anaerolineales bacterium]|nr:DUF1669 domain-containing protein [Anaerolineales bacterium]